MSRIVAANGTLKRSLYQYAYLTVDQNATYMYLIPLPRRDTTQRAYVSLKNFLWYYSVLCEAILY